MKKLITSTKELITQNKKQIIIIGSVIVVAIIVVFNVFYTPQKRAERIVKKIERIYSEIKKINEKYNDLKNNIYISNPYKKEIQEIQDVLKITRKEKDAENAAEQFVWTALREAAEKINAEKEQDRLNHKKQYEEYLRDPYGRHALNSHFNNFHSSTESYIEMSRYSKKSEYLEKHINEQQKQQLIKVAEEYDLISNANSASLDLLVHEVAEVSVMIERYEERYRNTEVYKKINKELSKLSRKESMLYEKRNDLQVKLHEIITEFCNKNTIEDCAKFENEFGVYTN
ncbi:MAG: hypothetical protein LBU90_08765 [Bacteroidales bacterium]|jgi:hypothetical protein|nr:hypothetical protein [Bacteroidales bacterium]